MRVLGLGSGPGDVAFQVAEMIGPNGSVVGVEQDPAQIAVAMQRRGGSASVTSIFATVTRARSWIRNRSTPSSVDC